MKKITVKIEVEATVKVEIDEDDLRRIAEDYKGDFKSYIENEIEWEISDCDIEHKDFSCNKEEILEAVKEFAKENEMNEDFSYPNKILRDRFLKIHKIEKDEFDIEIQDGFSVVLTNDDIIDACRFADYGNPREELDCIFIDGENIVATDTRKIIIKRNTNKIESCFIPRAFCELFLDSGGSFYKNDDGIYFENNGKFYSYHTPEQRYPDYKRIIPSKRITELSMSKYLEKSKVYKNEHSDKGVRIYKLDDKYLCLDESFVEKEFDCIGINEHNLPVVFEKQDTIVVVMSMFFNDDEIEEMLGDEG